MKTYIKQTTETKPRLIITHEDCPESPRKWSNLGYFVTIDSRYNSPDDNETLKDIIKEGGNILENQKEHIAFIKREYQKETGEKVLAIYPVTKYDHSGVTYRLGTVHGFDNSNNGFYVVTDKTQKELGTNKKDFESVISHELKTYTQWCNGEVYQYQLFDSEGETIDSCAGFYGINEIKDALPDEWKNEKLSDYMQW